MKKNFKPLCSVWHEHQKKLLIMRNTLLIIILSTLQVIAGSSYSQTARLNLELKGATIKEVLTAIEKQSEFYFLYNSELIDVTRKVDISVQGEKVADILARLFNENEVNVVIKDRHIVLTPVEEMVQQQQRSVSGKVTDSSGSPLPGVTVLLKGTTQGTVTNSDGFYSMVGITENATLVFSFVGMRTLEVAGAGKTVINVILEEESIGIEEVVAIGYGTQKKVNLTGSVAVASKEVFENKSVPNAIAAIQGSLPGVTVTRSSGKPGSENYQLQIRGRSSINTVGVLTLIDGVVGNLSDINPNDIESISVLKDAAAAAIYGSNAAGGVMLVTTKKGKAGITTVEYDGMFGITMMGRLPTPASAYDQMNTLAIGFRAAGSPILEWESPVRLAWLKGEKLDETDYMGAKVVVYPTGRFFVTSARPNVWQSANSINQLHEYTKENNPVQTHNVSITGGNDKNRYYFSAGYYNRRGILRYGPDSNERYNIRFNSNNELSKHISINTSVAFTNNDVYQSSVSGETILNYAIKYWSTGVTYGPTGAYFASHGLWPSWVQVMREGGRNTQKSYNFDGKSELIIKDLLPGLRINVIGGANYVVGKSSAYARTLTYIGPQGTPTFTYSSPNNMSKSQSLSKYVTLQSYATYDLNINDAHNFSLLGGYSFEDFRSESITATARTLATNDFFSLNYGSPSTKGNSDAISTWATIAGFGRLNYNFKEKYLFEANIRYDASSRLASGNRGQVFPSFSAGWNISKEDFYQNVKAFQDLKLRASWGQLGNSNALGLYDYIALLNSSTNLPFNNVSTQYLYQNTLASKTKTWETIETANLGLDLTAFNRKLSFTADAYIKKNKNMLVNIQSPSLMGVGTSSYNYGDLETRGWEIAIGWKEMSKEFKYGITASLSDNTNKLTKYSGRNIVSAGQNFLIEGLPLNTLWGYQTGGLFKSDQEYKDYGIFIDPRTGGGDMKYLDLNNDKKITVGAGTLNDHGDLVRLGDTNPRYLFGINLEGGWKGFDFNCFIQGVGKRELLLQNGDIWNSMYTTYSDAVNLTFKEKLDYWTPENTDAFWPRPFNGGMQSYWPSDYWIQDAAYVRLKNIQLGYTIPQTITQKARISKARFFVTGQDLLEITKTFSWVDPEQADNSGVIYPFYRSISLGINVTF